MRSIRKGTARSTVALVAVVAGMLALAGCSSASTNAATSKLVSRAPAASGPVESLTWNLPNGEPDTINPPNAVYYPSAGVVSNLCDPLLAVNENYDLSSNLVSSKQETPTKLVYTLVAKATFWDGKPVTVDDIVYSLRQAADPKSVVSAVYQNVSSIEATSPTQVTVNFKQPDELFNSEMATFAGMVVEKDFAEKAGAKFGSSAGGIMCSGPYEFVSWTPGDSIKLKKNPDYWNKKVPQHAAAITFRFITDSTAYTQALTAGEIDGSYQISASSIPSLQKSKNGAVYFGPSMESWALNVARPDGPLADVNLRDALQVSIDRDALARVVFHGAATSNYTELTPRTWPNDQKAVYQKAYDQWAKKRAFNIDQAKELVKKSKYDSSPVVLGTQAGDETSSTIAQLVQQQAKKAGITVKIDEIQPLQFSTAGYDEATRKQLGVDLLLTPSFNAAADPLEPLGFVYLPDSPYNYTKFDDAKAVSLLNEARQTFDDKKRAQLIVEFQDIAEKDSAVIPLVSSNTVTYLNKKLGGAITSFAYMSMPALGYIGSK
ncbi:ABC transporter substrate-binding protein [Leifsonia xyli]|uniref:ABC transporter substrate-binding protein n=1 Tax=Leifsonia xyli TaxID=1575 RepID=UPI003D6786B0